MASTNLKVKTTYLKSSLIWRILIIAVASFVMMTALMIYNSRQETKHLASQSAEVVSGYLRIQLHRIHAQSFPAYSFPDFNDIIQHITSSGQCVRYEDIRGSMMRSKCVGSINILQVPSWFSSLHFALFGGDYIIESPVSYRGIRRGTIIVSSDMKTITARSWREIKPMLSLTALTVTLLCLFVFFAIERALSPTKDLVAGLDRLANGEFGYRLPRFRLFELQRISEVSNQLADKIEETIDERAALSNRLVNAQEEERRHLARELHDEFAQNLTALTAVAAAIEKSVEEQSNPHLSKTDDTNRLASSTVKDEVKVLTQISRNMMLQLRTTLAHLRPADMEKVGLIESLRQLLSLWRVASKQKINFFLDAPEDLEPLPNGIAIHIYRICQEALTNAVRHASARNIHLKLEEIEMGTDPKNFIPGIELIIDDDGKHISNSHCNTKIDLAVSGETKNISTDGLVVDEMISLGMGLPNMKERVMALRGLLKFETNADGGFKVIVRIPLDETNARKRPGQFEDHTVMVGLGEPHG